MVVKVAWPRAALQPQRIKSRTALVVRRQITDCGRLLHVDGVNWAHATVIDYNVLDCRDVIISRSLQAVGELHISYVTITMVITV